VWELRKKFPRDGRSPHPVFPRPAPVHEDPSIGGEWRSEHLQDFTLICSYCGLEGDATALLKDHGVHELFCDMRSEEVTEPTAWWTNKQAAREMRITPQTLNRYILQDRLKTHMAAGAVYVNADQLREIWRGKRFRDQNPRLQEGA
jgi:hypothetical protein